MDRTKVKIKLLQLQKFAHNPSFITSFDGRLFQKRKRGTDVYNQQFVSQFKDDLDRFKLKLIPRAKVAVSMSFHSNDQNTPTLHKLVKFYLDLLKGVAFSDDRQVYYLEAFCYHSEKADQLSRLYIQVDRLTNYLHKLNLFYEFKDLVDYSWTGYDQADIDEELLNSFDLPMQQSMLLRQNGIKPYDRPGNGFKHFSGDFSKIFRLSQDLHPFAFNLGDLPQQGESDAYQERINEAILRFQARNKYFNKIVVPVELDIQVTPSALTLGKDLDNIFKDISVPFTKNLISNGGYISAFRIYVTKRIVEDESGCIRFKLLPFGAIQDVSYSIDSVLEQAIEWLKDRSYY